MIKPLRYRHLSIKHKLQLIIMATVAIALVLACGAVLTYGSFFFREGHVEFASRNRFDEFRSFVDRRG